MLKRLQISNYALIDRLEIEFGDGLTIITGETGAGKSILLGALSLIMGERAEAKVLRDPSRKTVVEATFTGIKDYEGLESYFAEADIDYDSEECVLRREVNSTGRSRAFINDTPAPVTVMRELATRLLDIHSQHSNMLLARPDFQLHIIDNIAADDALLATYREQYARYKELHRELTRVAEEYSRARADENYLRFQATQLQELMLLPDEDTNLETLHHRLSNATQLKTALYEASQLLNDGENSAIESINTAAHHLVEAARSLDELEGMDERLDSVLIELKDIARTITITDNALSCDPTQLDKVEERLGNLDAAKRRHGVETVNELIALQHDMEDRLHALDSSDEHLIDLRNSLAAQQEQVMTAAAALTAARAEAAGAFAASLKQLAQGLGIKNIEFKVELQQAAPGENGCDDIRFLTAFNKNQPLMAIKDTASGGELSRVMLCIKTIVARHMQLPTIIFDEVDTGVSGDTASMIGSMMSDISRTIQVIAITHLPQVVAHADGHLKVYKTDTETDTVTQVSALSADEHVMEIARLLSGMDINNAAIENARALIATVKK